MVHGGRPHRFVICNTAAARAQAETEPDCLGPLPCSTAIPLAGLLDNGFYVLHMAVQTASVSASIQQSALHQAAGSAGA